MERSDKRINIVLAVLIALLVVELVAFITRPATPCYESLDVTKGQNFNQPILTEHNCSNGQVPVNANNF